VEAMRARAQRLFELVLESLRSLAAGSPEAAAEALLGAAELERETGRLAEADALATAAIGLSSRFRDRSAALEALFAGARIARARGRWREADERYREAEQLAEAAERPELAARAAVGRGNLAVDRGHWSEALERYETARGWVKRVPRPLPEAWHLALNCSIVARELGRLTEAEAELERARAALDPSDRSAEAIVENAHGQILLARGKLPEAEAVFRRALASAVEPDAVVTVSVNLAESLLVQGRVLEAAEVLRRAEETAVTRSVVPRLPELYALVARVLAARGHSDAFVLFERALQMAATEQLPDFERARVLEAYGRYDLDRGEQESGRARLEEAQQIYEGLGAEAALQRLRDLKNGAGGEVP